MNTVKNAIAASTLILANLFSPVASAEITGDQIDTLVDKFVTLAVASPNRSYSECVKNNFVSDKPGVDTAQWNVLYENMIMLRAANVVENEGDFEIAINDLLKQSCGDSQLAGGGKKSK